MKVKSNKPWRHWIEFNALQAVALICSLVPWGYVYGLSRCLAKLILWLHKDKKGSFNLSTQKSGLHVARANIEKCFSTYPPERIQEINLQHITGLMQTGIETLKFYSMTEKDQVEFLSKRVEILNPGCLHEVLESYPGCILWSPHYGNWEWQGYAISRRFPGRVANIYKTVRNPYIDQYMWRSRQQGVGEKSRVEEKRKFVKSMIRDLKNTEVKPKIYYMLSDQRPDGSQEKVSVNFLGRKTEFLAGAEKLARQKDLAMMYVKMMEKDDRKFTIEFIKIDYDSSYEYGEATKRAAKLLEAQLKESPQQWNWLYNLWREE